MSDIFLSYAGTDRDRAEPIARALSDRGWSVWWDRTIPPGKSFDEVIEQALDSAKCIIVLWSRTSVNSDWVKTEAAEGARRRILVPILLDEVKIPLEFRRIQAASLVTWDASLTYPELVRVFESVGRIVGEPPRRAETADEIPENAHTGQASTAHIRGTPTPRQEPTIPEQEPLARATGSAINLRLMTAFQMAVIWGVLVVLLFNDYLGHQLVNFWTYYIVAFPVLTGIWFAAASHSQHFRNGIILGWSTVAGYTFSWICLNTFPIRGTVFQVLGPMIFGILVIPLGIWTLSRLRAINRSDA